MPAILFPMQKERKGDISFLCSKSHCMKTHVRAEQEAGSGTGRAAGPPCVPRQAGQLGSIIPALSVAPSLSRALPPQPLREDDVCVQPSSWDVPQITALAKAGGTLRGSQEAVCREESSSHRSQPCTSPCSCLKLQHRSHLVAHTRSQTHHHSQIHQHRSKDTCTPLPNGAAHLQRAPPS